MTVLEQKFDWLFLWIVQLVCRHYAQWLIL